MEESPPHVSKIQDEAYSKTHDIRPTIKDYAVLSQHVYNVAQRLPYQWKILEKTEGDRDYVGVIYINDDLKQIIVAHKGTNSIESAVEDLIGIVFKEVTDHQNAAYNITKKAASLAKTKNYHLSITGHSLGAFLAEICTVFCHTDFSYPEVSCVTFESPGCKEFIEENIQSRMSDQAVSLNDLDIIGYVLYPNAINTNGTHIGSLYSLSTKTHFPASARVLTEAHSINTMVSYLEDPATIWEYMLDWPLKENLSNYIEGSKKNFDKHFRSHYKTDHSLGNTSVLPFRHLSAEMKNFLAELYEQRKRKERVSETAEDEFVLHWKNLNISNVLIDMLLNYTIEEHKSIKIINTNTTTIQGIFFRSTVAEMLSNFSKGNVLWSFDDVAAEQYRVKENTRSWNIPMIIPYYVVRKKLEDKIWEYLLQSRLNRDKIAFVSLSGLSGIGKTALASQIINNTRQSYDLILWIKADNGKSVEKDYLALGETYKLFASQSMDMNQKIETVVSWIESHKKVLIFYDHVTEMHLLQNYLPNKGHILITSENNRVPQKVIEVGVMDQSQGVELINSILPKELIENSNNCVKLCKKLGFLPLALSQAASYIYENYITVAEYLTLYETESTSLLSSSTLGNGPVYLTWDMSIKKILQHKNGKEALSFLYFIAYCNYDDIPKGLIKQYLYGDEDQMSTIAFNNILTILRRYSFVTISKDSISIHPLLHEGIKRHHKEKEKKKIAEVGLKAAIKFYKKDILISHKEEDRKSMILHMKLLLSLGCEMLDKNFLIKIYVDYGEMLYRIGMYAEASSCLEDALALSKDLPPNDLLNAKIFKFLGAIKLELFDTTGCERQLNSSLNLLKKHPKQYKELVRVYGRLALNHLYAGDFINCRKMLDQAYDNAKFGFHTDSLPYNNLIIVDAELNLLLGSYKKSGSLLEHALKKMKGQNMIYRHDNLSECLSFVEFYRGNYDMAKKTLKESLAKKKYKFGRGNVALLKTYYSMGTIYLYTGDIRKSQKYLNKSLNITKWGEKNLSSEIRLSEALSISGYNAEALSKIQRIVFTMEAEKTKNHFNISKMISAYRALANIMMRDNKEGQAGLVLEKIKNLLKIYPQQETYEHIALANSVAVQKALAGLYDEALVLFKNGKKKSVRHFSANHLQNYIFIFNEGITLFLKGDKGAAQDKFQKSFTFFNSVFGSNNFFTIISEIACAMKAGTVGREETLLHAKKHVESSISTACVYYSIIDNLLKGNDISHMVKNLFILSP